MYVVRICICILYVFVSYMYGVSLKKRSFVIPAPLEALGCSKGLDIGQKLCQTPPNIANINCENSE